MEIALLIKSSFPSNNFFFFFFFFLFLDIYRDSIKHVTLEEKKKGLNHAMNLQILIFHIFYHVLID